MDDLYNSKVRLGGALHCQAESSHSLLSLRLSTLEKQGVYSSLSLLLFGVKQPLTEAHPRLSFVSLLTVEVVVSDLYAAIKLTVEPVLAPLRGIVRFHTVLRDIANLSRAFCKFYPPRARRPVLLSPLPASDLSRRLSLHLRLVFLRLSFLLCLSVCSGLQRFQFAPGSSALLAAPSAVHRG